MNAQAIVDTLLEAGPDDMSPEAMRDFALGAREYALNKLPPEIATVLEYAPKDFVNAFFDKREAKWEPDRPFAEDWWASYDADDDSYRQYVYYSEYRTEGGRLYQSIFDSDTDGNGDFVDEAEIGTPEWKVMMEEFAYYKLLEQNAGYLKWVSEHDDDPLEFFMVHRIGELPQLAAERHRNAVKEARLAKRRHKRNPHYVV